MRSMHLVIASATATSQLGVGAFQQPSLQPSVMATSLHQRSNATTYLSKQRTESLRQSPASNEDQSTDTRYIVREAQAAEIDDISYVLVNAFYPNIKPESFTVFAKQKHEILQLMFDTPQYRRGMFVACTRNTQKHADEQQVIGYASIDRIKVRGVDRILGPQPKPSISELAVMPSHQRRGVATMLLNACEVWAASNCKDGKVYLSVNRDNDGARRMYESLGYTEATGLDYGKMSNLLRSRMDATVVWLEKSMYSGVVSDKL